MCAPAARLNMKRAAWRSPGGASFWGAPKILPPLGRNLAAWSPGGGANFRRAKWAGNFAPPGAQPGCLEARGGVNFWCQKILPPPLGRNWRFVKGRPPRNCFKIGPLNDAPKSQILYSPPPPVAPMACTRLLVLIMSF